MDDERTANKGQEAGSMIGACSGQLLRLGRRIAELEHARRSLPAGYVWTGDCQIAALRAEKQRLENLVAMPDLAGGGGSEADSAAAERATSVEAGGPQSNGTEATPDLPPDPEAATDALLEAATPSGVDQQSPTRGPAKTSVSPAVPVEPVTQPGVPVEPVTQTDAVLPDKEHVLAFLRREQEQKGCVTPRSLQRRNNRRFHNREVAAEVLNRLVDSGDLEWVEPGDVARVRNAPGGP
jgi:hypothetical protein